MKAKKGPAPAKPVTLRRKRAEIRHLAGVFQNEREPYGYVEIQGFDTLESGPPDLEPLNDDFEAALLVAEKAPGWSWSAMAYSPGDGSFFAIRRVGAEGYEVGGEVPGDAIAVVPAYAARAAGLRVHRDLFPH